MTQPDDQEEADPTRRGLVRLIRIGAAVAGAMLLIGAVWLTFSGYEAGGLLGAFPGLFLFVIGIFLIQAASYTPRR